MNIRLFGPHRPLSLYNGEPFGHFLYMKLADYENILECVHSSMKLKKVAKKFSFVQDICSVY